MHLSLAGKTSQNVDTAYSLVCDLVRWCGCRGQKLVLTWYALKNHEEKADKSKACCTKHNKFDQQDLPPLDCYAEIEHAECDLERNSNKHVKNLIQVTILQLRQ